MPEEKKEALKGTWHNGVIKTSQIETSTEKAHLIKARDNSGYLMWMPQAWFWTMKDSDKELMLGFIEGKEYVIYKNEENKNGFNERIDEKTVGWQEAFNIFACPPRPQNKKTEKTADGEPPFDMDGD